MYEQHFGFQTMPFSVTPAAWQFYESESSDSVLPAILHTMQAAAGVAVVTGPDGVGKTVLLNHVQAILSRQGQAVVLPGISLKTTEDLYLCIRRILKSEDTESVTAGSGRWDIVERLQTSAEFWGPIALLVDDAQFLSAELFNELKFLLEQRTSSHPMCRLFLAGSHALEETLAQPAISGFAQRIRTYNFLQPLRLKESVEYIRSRIEHAGGCMTDCFDTDAVEAVVDAADGNPRCVNLLADESLLTTCRDGKHRVTRECVHKALRVLQHLPHTWNVSVDQSSTPDDAVTNAPIRDTFSDGVIEFGAEPDSGCIETEHTVASVPTGIINSQETVELSGEHDTEESFDSESFEDLPPLDELVSDPRPDDLIENEPESFRSDYQQTVDSEFSVDADYVLADLESVGEPAMDIDADLDQRLIHNADAVMHAGTHNQNTVPDFNELLAGFSRWSPPGRWPAVWNEGDELVRYWARLESSDRKTRDFHSIVSEQPAQSSQVQKYEINIPPCEVPLPLWPPQPSGIGPVNPVPVNGPPESTPIKAVDFENTAEPTFPGSLTTVQESCAPQINAAENCQHLLNHLTNQDISAGDHESDATANVTETDVIPLRLAGTCVDSQQETEADESFREKTAIGAPVWTEQVEPNRVTERLERQTNPDHRLEVSDDTMSSPAGDTDFSAGESVLAAAPPEQNHSSEHLVPQCAEEDPASPTLELVRPKLTNRAQQVVTARPLKKAAGAENYVLYEDESLTFSLTPRDEPDKSGEDKPDVFNMRLQEFRTLFTRIRSQQQ